MGTPSNSPLVVEETTFHGPFNRFRVERVRSTRPALVELGEAVSFMAFDAEVLDDVTSAAACVAQGTEAEVLAYIRPFIEADEALFVE